MTCLYGFNEYKKWWWKNESRKVKEKYSLINIRFPFFPCDIRLLLEYIHGLCFLKSFKQTKKIITDLLPSDSYTPTLHLVAYSVNQKGRSDPTVLEDIAINEAEKRTGMYTQRFPSFLPRKILFNIIQHAVIDCQWIEWMWIFCCNLRVRILKELPLMTISVCMCEW